MLMYFEIYLFLAFPLCSLWMNWNEVNILSQINMGRNVRKKRAARRTKERYEDEDGKEEEKEDERNQEKAYLFRLALAFVQNKRNDNEWMNVSRVALAFNRLH